MSTSAGRQLDVDRVREALQHELKVHVRIQDQGHAPDTDARRRLAQVLPDLSAFGDHTFHTVRAVLDWDHQIPSQYVILRILCCYDAATRDRIDARLAARDKDIEAANLYPEFDVPDYGDVEGNETYLAVLRPGSSEVEDFRFISPWRKQVENTKADAAIRIVRENEGYQRAADGRTSSGLGGPVVIGWAPPCLGDTENWAIEVWLLTEFDGQSGKAKVFMVDVDRAVVSREFDTDVQLA